MSRPVGLRLSRPSRLRAPRAFILLVAALSAPLLLGRSPTAEDRLAEIEKAYAEGSHRRALELCRESVEHLEGDARGRCVAVWALSAEKMEASEELRALYEREIERVPFPHRATLAQAEGRGRARMAGSFEKLEPLERALALWEAGGEPHRGEWCDAAFDLIEGLSIAWQHDLPAPEWEKEPQPEDPEERAKAYEEWQYRRGLAEDRRRWERTETLFAGILELAPDSERRGRALLERGMRRLVAHGEAGIDPLRGLTIDGVIAAIRERSGGGPAAAALEEWRDVVLASIADWRRLAAELPNDSRADDAAFLVGWATEERLADLAAAEKEYEAFLAAYPESQWRTDALARSERIAREGIAIIEPPAVFPLGTAPRLELEARNVEEIECSLWRVPDYLDRVEDKVGLEPEPAALAGGEPLAPWTVSTGATADRKAKRVQVVVPAERAGAYRLRIQGRQSAIEVPLFVSGLALHVEGGSDEAIAWATSGSDGVPVAGAEVLLRLDIRRRDEHRSWTTRLTSAADGTVRWRYPERFLPLLEDGWRLDRLAAVAALGDEIAPAPAFHPTFDAGRRPRHHYYAETDRPVYRPGQTVEYKVTLRRWDGDRYGLPAAGTEAALKIVDPQGNPLIERTAAVDADGAIAGELRLGEEITLGMCELHVGIGGKELPPRGWSRSLFRVEEYRRPEFEVAVDAPAEPVLYGDPLSLAVTGRFLSGEPVRGGRVRIRVQRHSFSFSYRPPSPYPWPTEREEHGFWGGEDVFSGEATLDGEGIAEFTVPTAEPGDGLDSRYVVEAWLTDASEREERAATSFPVTRTALFAHLEPRSRLVAPGEPIEVTVRAMDATERGRSAAGEIELARRVDREEMQDGELRPVIDWEPIRTVPFRTEEEGSVFREVATEEGELRLTFRARDDRGKEFEGSTRVWVVGAEFTGRDYRLDGLELVASTPVARIGEEARLAVLTQRPDATILVMRSAAGRVLGIDVVRAKGQVAQLRFPVTDAEMPNFFVDVLAVWDGKMHRAQASIDVPADPYFLEGTLTAKPGELLPGAETLLELVLRDRAGKPVEGTFTLTLFDRALLAIQPEIALGPEQHFHERRWIDAMQHGSSLGWRSDGDFSWFPGKEPPARAEHRLPDLLRHTWQRRFEYLAMSIHRQGGPLAGLLREAPETIRFFGAEYAHDFGSGGLLDLATGAAKAPGERMRGSSERQLDAGDDESKGLLSLGEEEGDGGAPAPVRIRQNFAETAAWEPHFRTDAAGRASLRVTMPDSLTAWNGIARGIDASGRAFEARVEVRTKRNIRLRVAATRFLREGDEVVLSLIASNQFAEPVSGRLALDFPTAQLAYRGESAVAADPNGRSEVSFPVEIPAAGETTIELPFRAGSPGTARLIATLATPRESDGLEQIVPVLPYGLERLLGSAGVAADADGASTSGWTFAVPELSDEASRALVVDLTPSPAIALIESLPYLVQYPYGCVEQTLDRFIPAAVVADTLRRSGVDLAEILPERAAERPVGFWGHLRERPLELFREDDLAHLISVGMAKLRQAQNGDGSFGWWSGYDGDLEITALVVEHLATAHEAGIAVDAEMAAAAARWLDTHALGRDLEGELDIYERPGLESLVWTARALLHAAAVGWIPAEEDGRSLFLLLDLLHRERGRLGAKGKALLALALHDSARPEDREKAGVIIRNLYDEEGGQDRFGTVHFGRGDALAGYDHGVESTAWALRALIAIVPDDPRIPRVVRWLLENRQGSHYDSTRSTATVALALTDWLASTRELDCDLRAAVRIDGREVGTFAVDRKSLFTKRGRIEVPAALLEAGEHRLEIVREGRGPLYWSAALTFTSREDPVPAGGNRVEVARRLSRIVDVQRPREQEEVIDGKAVIRTVLVWERELQPIGEDTPLAPGERVLVELEVTSANSFRYVVVENPKPAGFETVAVQSGFVGGIYGYRELRDEKIAWFASLLPEGNSTVSIELRAERPGTFRTVPATIEAMYLPHVRANSRSERATVR